MGGVIKEGFIVFFKYEIMEMIERDRRLIFYRVGEGVIRSSFQ